VDGAAHAGVQGASRRTPPWTDPIGFVHPLGWLHKRNSALPKIDPRRSEEVHQPRDRRRWWVALRRRSRGMSSSPRRAPCPPGRRRRPGPASSKLAHPHLADPRSCRNPRRAAAGARRAAAQRAAPSAAERQGPAESPPTTRDQPRRMEAGQGRLAACRARRPARPPPSAAPIWRPIVSTAAPVGERPSGASEEATGRPVRVGNDEARRPAPVMIIPGRKFRSDRRGFWPVRVMYQSEPAENSSAPRNAGDPVSRDAPRAAPRATVKIAAVAGSRARSSAPAVSTPSCQIEVRNRTPASSMASEGRRRNSHRRAGPPRRESCATRSMGRVHDGRPGWRLPRHQIDGRSRSVAASRGEESRASPSPISWPLTIRERRGAPIATIQGDGAEGGRGESPSASRRSTSVRRSERQADQPHRGRSRGRTHRQSA